jgi:hypothetical protein
MSHLEITTDPPTFMQVPSLSFFNIIFFYVNNNNKVFLEKKKGAFWGF